MSIQASRGDYYKGEEKDVRDAASFVFMMQVLQSLDIYWFKEQCYTNCPQCELLASRSWILTDGYSLFRITEMQSRVAFGWSV